MASKPPRVPPVEQVIRDFDRLSPNDQVAVAKYIARQVGQRLFTESEVKQMLSDAQSGPHDDAPVVNGVARLK